MLLNMQFDAEASKISEKLMFSCEKYELRREDITQLKKEKLVKYIQEEDLPEIIPCQILMFLDNPRKARIVLYNTQFTLPKEVLDNHFLNKDLIEQCKVNGWFWLEFLLPMNSKGITLDFSYDI